MIIKCPCKKDIYVPKHLIGRKKYCSLKCKHKYSTRKSGLTYNIKKKNKGWFKKGKSPWNKGKKNTQIPWNKGLKGIHFSPKTEFKKGEEPWNKGKKHPKITKEKNHNWKGDGVSYNGLHNWLIYNFKKPKKCSHCKQIKDLDWANISGEYKRDIKDYIALCRKCHKKFDKGGRSIKY